MNWLYTNMKRNNKTELMYKVIDNEKLHGLRLSCTEKTQFAI